MEILAEKLESIDRKIDKIDNIEHRLTIIEDKLEFAKDSGIRMNNHITFIESVFDTVKIPFFYIMNKIKPIDTKTIEMKYIRTLECEKYLREKTTIHQKNDWSIL